MSITIRTANKDDTGPIAETIYSAGPDVYDYLYGDKAVDFISFEFLSGKGFAGYNNVTVAVENNEVVATGCFYGLDNFETLIHGTVDNTLQFFDKEANQVLKRLATTAEVVKPPAIDEVYLSNFGVVASMQGQGIGSQLIEYELSQAKQEGLNVFGLDVSANNPRAQALYERLGLVVTSETQFPVENSGVSNSRKMEMHLK